MNQKPILPERERHTQRFTSARMNLLLMIILTVVNIVLMFTGSETMLLFSATVPYFAAMMGSFATVAAIAIACYVVAATTIVVYLVCWLMSKKHPAWLIVALVMFAVDCALLAYIYVSAGDFSGILDALFHAWILYYLISGIISGSKLKKLPAEEITAIPETVEVTADVAEAAAETDESTQSE